MKHRSWIGSMLNWRVITAYLIFFSSLFINITAMGNGVEMKELPIMESLGYVFVPILSYFFIGEKITKRVCLSMAFILLGIYVFYLK
jgi:drug/metabolite transporter (DMT)-like permease